MTVFTKRKRQKKRRILKKLESRKQKIKTIGFAWKVVSNMLCCKQNYKKSFKTKKKNFISFSLLKVLNIFFIRNCAKSSRVENAFIGCIFFIPAPLYYLFILTLPSYTTCQLCWGSLNFLSRFFLLSFGSIFFLFF